MENIDIYIAKPKKIKKVKNTITNRIMKFYKNDGTETDLDNCDFCQLELIGSHADLENALTLVSKASIGIVTGFVWYLGKDGYPVAYKCVDDNTIKLGKGIKLHKLLMGDQCPPGMVIDHINRNKLDNRIENLRVCTPQENSYNTTKKNSNNMYKGVKKTKNGEYTATIMKDGVRHEIKNIKSEKEAAKIYDMMAENLFGNFAGKNFM